jgi:hypothetical protein
MAEWRLDADDARGEQMLGPVRHRGHGDGGQASTLELTCQHGHVLAAVRSGGGEHDAVGAFVA